MPVFFFENRATKTCQCLALIGNLIPLFTWKVKSDLKKNSGIHELSFHRNVCLEGNKSVAFLISLKAFYETILVLASPIAKPFPQFFIATGLPNTIQTNTAQQNQVLQTTNLTACWLGTLSKEWVIACMQIAEKTA